MSSCFGGWVDCGGTCQPPTYQCCGKEGCPSDWFCCSPDTCVGFIDMCKSPQSSGPPSFLWALAFIPIAFILFGVMGYFYFKCKGSQGRTWMQNAMGTSESKKSPTKQMAPLLARAQVNFRWVFFIAYADEDAEEKGVVDLLKSDLARCFEINANKIFTKKDLDATQDDDDTLMHLNSACVPLVLLSQNFCRSASRMAEVLTCVRNSKPFVMLKLSSAELDYKSIQHDIESINETFAAQQYDQKMGTVTPGEIERLKHGMTVVVTTKYHAQDNLLVRNADIETMFDGFKQKYSGGGVVAALPV